VGVSSKWWVLYVEFVGHVEGTRCGRGILEPVVMEEE